MSVHMAELERVARIRRRVGLLVVLAVISGLGAWLAGPFGIVLLTDGDAAGWVLVVVGALLLAACVTAIVFAARVHRAVAPQSLPGKENPSFNEPVPSQDPRPGIAWAGSQLGSN
jgi:hypothetical protein